jgi:hypothetical protein
MLDYAHADAQGGDQPSTLVLDAMTSKGLGYLNKSESPYSSTAVSVPAKKEKTQAHTRNEGQAVTTLLKHQKVLIAHLNSLVATCLRVFVAGEHSQHSLGQLENVRLKKSGGRRNEDISRCLYPRVSIVLMEIRRQELVSTLVLKS